MTARYRTETRTTQVYDGTYCDGCGSTDPYLVTVVISVHEGEEMGGSDEYDYCDNCLDERADALVAAGSKAPIVTSVDEPIDQEEDE